MYKDEDLLMLSGIQHYVFCQRQWALIHIEQQWEENHLTIEGQWLHRKADNPFAIERDGDTVYLHSVSLVSHELGLYGIADILEMHLSENKQNAITIPKYPGQWQIYPIEYKHGKPKTDNCDAVQLCAQAMCLEEMYNIKIEQGGIFYGEIKHRCNVIFTDKLRETVKTYCQSMHDMYDKKQLIPAEYETKCKSCSLSDLCMVDSENKSKNLKTYLSQLEE